MKELVIISGKGGTGKTCLTAAFSSLAENKVLCDADVDAANLHLITDPSLKERHGFQSGHTAIIHKDKCSECGLCRDLCQWNAISSDFEVDSLECEGCGVCVYFCPENAVDFPGIVFPDLREAFGTRPGHRPARPALLPGRWGCTCLIIFQDPEYRCGIRWRNPKACGPACTTGRRRQESPPGRGSFRKTRR